MLRAGSYRIDLDAELLWHDAQAIPLRPKTWLVLRYLVEAAGHLVTKRELLDRVWQDTAVEEKTLNASIAEIRHAFGDSAREPRYVETVHRRGFRFVAALSSTDEPAPATIGALQTRRSAAERSPFLGRETELHSLRRMRVALRDGLGAVVTLSGPAGAGKSRLVRELLADEGADDGSVLIGRCLEGAGVPYWPWVEMLRVYIRASGPEAVRAACGDAAGELARIVPALGGEGGSGPSSRLEPDLTRLLLFDALGRFFEVVEPGRPLVVVIEDLHWADASSLQALQALASRIAARPALVVVTLRDDDVVAAPRLRAVVAGLARESARGMRLEGLSETAAHALVRALGGDRMPAPVADRIVAVSEGNPFFIEETVRHLSDLALIDHAAGWRSQLVGRGLELPASVSDVFERRLRRLSPQCRRLVDLAAVVGTEVDEWLVGEAGELGEEELIALLGEAMEASILQEVAAHPGRYRFGHALMRFTLYNLLSAPLRRRWHRRVAEAIEAVRGDQGDAPAVLALHLCRAVPAVPAERAIAVALRAAQHARAQLAYESEAELCRGAFELAAAAEAPALRRRLAELAVRQAEALQRAGDADAAGGLFRDAATHAREHDEPVWMARSALGLSTLWEPEQPDIHAQVEEALARLGDRDLSLRTRLLARLAVLLYPLNGTRDRCEQLCSEALAGARSVGGDRLLGQTLVDWLAAQWYPDNLAAQLHAGEELMSVAQRSGDRELRATAHGWLTVIGFGTGAVDRAEREIGALVALAAELRQPIHQWCGLYLSATLALLRGDLAGAERLSLDAFEIGQRCSPASARRVRMAQTSAILREQNRCAELLPFLEQADGALADIALWMLPYYLVEADRFDEARAALGRARASGLDTMLGDNSRNRRLLTLGTLAFACSALGEIEMGEEVYELIAPQADRWVLTGWGYVCVGVAGTSTGALATSLRRWSAAERHFEAAIAAHDRAGAPIALATGYCLYARMLLERGRRADRARARDLAARATEISRDLGLPRVAKLLDRLPSLA